jgi:hypothetical protein
MTRQYTEVLPKVLVSRCVSKPTAPYVQLMRGYFGRPLVTRRMFCLKVPRFAPVLLRRSTLSLRWGIDHK